METLRRLAVAGLLTAVVVSGVAVAVVGPPGTGPHSSHPGWNGSGHTLLDRLNVSLGPQLSFHVTDAVRTGDGGRIVVGHRRFKLRAFKDDWIATAVRLGPDGTIEWQTDLAPNESEATEIVETTDGYAVAGRRDGEAFVVPLGPDGEVSNRVNVDLQGPAVPAGLAATPDGGVLLVGYKRIGAPDRAFSPVEGGVADASGWAVRIDADWTTRWERQFDAIPYDVLYDDGAFLAVGRKDIIPGDNSTIRPWLQRFTGPSETAWSRTWSLNGSLATRIAPSGDGYIVGGSVAQFSAATREQVYTAAVFGASGQGEQQWARVLADTGGGRVTDAVTRSDGTVALAATVDTNRATNLAVVTADSSGVTGATVLGGPTFDSASAIWPGQDDSLAVTGDLERPSEAERRNALLVSLRVTSVATEVLPPEEIPRDRNDVTLTPTTTRADVVYGPDVTPTTGTNATATGGDDPGGGGTPGGGLPLLGIAVYLVPFAIVVGIVLEVRRRLR